MASADDLVHLGGVAVAVFMSTNRVPHDWCKSAPDSSAAAVVGLLACSHARQQTSPYNESMRVCRKLMLRLIHLPFICMHKNKPFYQPTPPTPHPQIIIQRHALYMPIASEEFGRKVPKNSAVAVAPLCLSLPPQSVLLFEPISFILTSCCTLHIFCVCRWGPGSRGTEIKELCVFSQFSRIW